MVNWILQILNKAVNDKFFGSVTINFQAGKVQNCEVKQSHKPPVDLD